MADYFLQGFGSILPDNHPARMDLMQAPRLGKEKHTGLVAYELAELAVDWLQELVGEEGGEKKLLDNLPAPNVDLEGRPGPEGSFMEALAARIRLTETRRAEAERRIPPQRSANDPQRPAPARSLQAGGHRFDPGWLHARAIDP